MNDRSMAPQGIRVIAICLFSHEDRILVFEGYDAVKGSRYYRPLGGGVEPGERAVDALHREIWEELGQEITDVRLLTVLENLFVLDGRPGHEIVFLFDARFEDPTLYQRKALTVTEDNGETLTAQWRSLDSFDEQGRLVPEALADLLPSSVQRLSSYFPEQ